MAESLAPRLMADFARTSGVSGETPPRRYLWTDAFAVCTFLGLFRQHGDQQDLRQAQRLVEQVHQVLGQHRSDDARSGWISGLSPEEGERHPTRGGLRIGKTLPERRADQPADAASEWDRDGQYFHYLTKWMHALQRMAQETGEARYRRWSMELALTAHQAFTCGGSSTLPKRMVWKKSIDLSRPLVTWMGHHDPLDGLVAYLTLQASAPSLGGEAAELESPIADMVRICEESRWTTDDPLGTGGLLDHATWLAQLVFQGGLRRLDLLTKVLFDAMLSVEVISASRLLGEPAERRLPFRELGLSIGLHGIERVRSLLEREREVSILADRLLDHRQLAPQIEDFWCDAVHRRARTWLDHREINAVMLATSLEPSGYLDLRLAVEGQENRIGRET